MKFSVGSWSFHELYGAGKLNIFGYFESVKYRYHLDSVDIWTGMLTSTDEEYIQTIKASLNEEGMSLACLATDAHIWNDDAEIRERNNQLIRRYIEIAKTLGAETLRLDVGASNPELSDEQFDYIVKQYQSYAHTAKESGFRVGPQTHSPAAQVPKNVKRLVEAVSSSGFGIIVDVDRWIEDKELGDEMCAPYAMLLHFDSSRTTTREQLESKVQLFVDSGYKGCWSLEYRLGGSEYLGVACDLAELRRAVFLATR